MENIEYIKDFRTGLRNILQKEISLSLEILQEDIPKNKTDIKQQLTKCIVCLKKIPILIEKVEMQSEKLCSLLDDSESDLLEKVIEDDSNLLNTTIECCVKLRQHKEMLTSLNSKTVESQVTQKPDQSAFVNKIMQIQKDMK